MFTGDIVISTMSGRAVLSEVGSGHTLEVKTTDVTVTRQAHFDSSKTTSPLVCDVSIGLFFPAVQFAEFAFWHLLNTFYWY